MDALPELQGLLDPGAEVHAFTDSEALEALDHIIRTKPPVVVLHDEFSVTSRGQALINRIKADPSLGHCEVRLLARDSAFSRVATTRDLAADTAAAVNEPAPALDQSGTRRAARVRMGPGVEVTIDGKSAALVDLSAVGAQVISSNVLKPNQRVRLLFGEGKTAIRCSGAIVWASFEMPKGLPTRYRAGIDWGLVAEGPAIESFAERHRKE